MNRIYAETMDRIARVCDTFGAWHCLFSFSFLLNNNICDSALYMMAGVLYILLGSIIVDSKNY